MRELVLDAGPLDYTKKSFKITYNRLHFLNIRILKRSKNTNVWNNFPSSHIYFKEKRECNLVYVHTVCALQTPGEKTLTNRTIQ